MSPARWQGIWSRRGPLACLLWPVSLLYGALAEARRRLYAAGMLKVQRLPVPVIVVGNVIVGGAGKTPTVIALVRHLQELGWRPGVISRGYGRSDSAIQEVHADTPAELCGDEPALIRHATGIPVFVAPRRIDAGRALLATHPEVNLVLCDDGLQHLSLGRDLSIAVFDDRGVGNGWLLPAGLLREPWPPRPGNLFQPDLVLCHQREGSPSRGRLAGTGNRPTFSAVRRLAEQAVGPQGQHIFLHDLKSQALSAVAGVARPEVFFDMLRERGLTLAHTLALPDHADSSALETLQHLNNQTLVCTEKDAVKLFPSWPAGQRPAWAIPLELVPEPAFWSALDTMLAPLKAQP